MSWSMQYSTTPLSRFSSCHTLSSTCTAEISAMRRASSICPTFTLHRPIRATRPFVLQCRERTHAGGQRHSRIGRVKLIEVDALDAERAQAGVAGVTQVTGSAVGHPLPVRSCQSALCRNHEARAIAAPGRERAGDEPLVVADLGIVPAVGIGRIEKRDAGVQRGVQHLDAARLVAVALGREAHAADADGFHVGSKAKCKMRSAKEPWQ